MARPPKDLNTYPLRFFEIAEEAFRQQEIHSVVVPDRRAVVSTIHAFNRFRVALAKSGHPHAGAVNDLIVRAGKMESLIEFVARGLWNPESEILLGLDSLNKSQASAASIASSQLDHTEQALDSFLQGDGKCVHERNEYGICVKCGEPL